MFKHIWENYNLYKSPKRIGDSLEHRGETFYIIGIEEIRFERDFSTISILFTCQNLNVSFERVHPRQRGDWELQVGFVTLKTPLSSNRYGGDPIKTVKPGRIVPIHGKHYKIVEYTDVEIKGTDIIIHFYVKELQAIQPKLAKTMMLESRKKKLGLQVYEGRANVGD